MIRTIDEKVINPNSSNIFVQKDAAHNSSQRQVIDYIYEAGQAPKKITQPQQYDAGGCAKRARCYLLVVLLGGSFSTLLCSLCVGCAHGCVHERAKNRPNVNVTSGSGTRAKGVIIPLNKVYPLHARTMLDVAETRGFALSMPMGKEVLKACHARHSARIAPKLRQRDRNG